MLSREEDILVCVNYDICKCIQYPTYMVVSISIKATSELLYLIYIIYKSTIKTVKSLIIFINVDIPTFQYRDV